MQTKNWVNTSPLLYLWCVQITAVFDMDVWTAYDVQKQSRLVIASGLISKYISFLKAYETLIPTAITHYFNKYFSLENRKSKTELMYFKAKMADLIKEKTVRKKMGGE